MATFLLDLPGDKTKMREVKMEVFKSNPSPFISSSTATQCDRIQICNSCFIRSLPVNT